MQLLFPQLHVGLYIGIALTGLVGFFVGYAKGLAIGFLLSMLLGMVLWIILPKSDLVPIIKTKDRIRLSFKDSFFVPQKEWFGHLMAAIVIWIFFGWVMNKFIGIIALGIGLIGFLTSLFWMWFYAMVNRSFYPVAQISKPYERLRNSLFLNQYAIFDHCLLRWQLYRAGVLPLRLVDFLNEMTERHLLETDGATWRFRHRILQEYFTGQWQEKPTQNT